MIERTDELNDDYTEPIASEQSEPATAQVNRFEDSLRPQQFADYVGQEEIKQNLQLAITAAQKRLESLEHILLYGPPGLGKTTLAGVIGNEMTANVKVTSGPAIERAGDLASMLTNLADGDILFIDEVHRLPRTVEEILYPAMEDYVIDIMLGKGPTAQSLRLDLPRFTIIGATTRFGALSSPFRDRFGLIHRLEYYNQAEIEQIIKRSAKLMKLEIDKPATIELASRARLTPRIANRLLKRVRDYAQVHGDGAIDTGVVAKALALLQVDELGLDLNDRRILTAIIENFAGGPAGVEAVAAATGEERQTIEDVYEPYLIQLGLLERTTRGRKVTGKAYVHLGVAPPNDKGQAKLL